MWRERKNICEINSTCWFCEAELRLIWLWISAHNNRKERMFALGCHKFLSHSEYSFCWMHNLNLHTDQRHQAQLQSEISTPFCVTFHKTHNFYLVSFCAIVQWFFHVNSRPAASLAWIRMIISTEDFSTLLPGDICTVESEIFCRRA